MAALLTAVPALGSSPIATKRAEAAQVYAQIIQLDRSLSRDDELIDLANLRLAHVEYEQNVNTRELAVARVNLARSQKMIAERLVSLYTTPQPTTIEMILGATSLNSMLTRIDNEDHVSSLDAQVLSEVETYKSEVYRARSNLAVERVAASQLVTERRHEQLAVQDQIDQKQHLMNSIRSQIATLEAQAAAEQRELQAEDQAQVQAAQDAEQQAADEQVIGASAATPGASVLPASPYGAQVVQIAMSYLGVPYVWGGATPSGFDCSGLVMYSFAQLGISLPHSSYAMWDYGVPVPENQLEPGDIVFFEDLGHVGIYIGGGEYVNAPYTGAVVSVASLETGWSAENYVGARRIL